MTDWKQAVIDEIEERKNANGYRNAAVISELNRLEGYIMRLPSAQPEQQWIPCSDHTPDTPIRVQVQLDNGWIITAYRQEDEWLSVPDCGEALRDEWVVAWMPMPESWRGEEHDRT